METATEITTEGQHHRILWRQFIDGDNNAIHGIYTSYLPQLVFTAYHYTHDKERARDAVGDVFERLLTMDSRERKNKLGNVDQKLETFLTVIVKNRCLNLIKIENNRRGIIRQIGHRFAENTAPPAYFSDDFRQLLHCLSERQYAYFNLHCQGYKNGEIADQFNVKEQTVKNTLVTAKRKLRALYYTFMD